MPRICIEWEPMDDSNMTKNTRYIVRNRIKYQRTKIYDQISDILEKLLGAFHFDSVDSILEAIFTKTCNCEIEGYDYCQNLIKLCKEMHNVHKKLENNLEKIIKQ